MAAALGSAGWEKLVEGKQNSYEVTKASARGPPNLTHVPGRLLLNSPLAQTLCALGAGSSRSLRILGVSIWRKVAELQVEAQLRRLVAKSKNQVYGPQEPDNKVSINIRSEWFQLQSLVFQGGFSKSIKCKVIRSRAQLVSTQLSAQASVPPPGVYEDLIQLAGAICSFNLSHTVDRLVWDTLLRELVRGSTNHLVAAIDPDDETAPLILRHLAACKLAAWKTLPGEHTLTSLGDTKTTIRRQAFSWDTYGKQVDLTTGFYDLLLGLLKRSPRLVHTAFDDNFVHLLWLPKYMAESGTYTGVIEMSYVLDDLSYWYHAFYKRLNAAISPEHDFLVHFLASAKDDALLKGAVEHLRSAIIPLSQTNARGFATAAHDVFDRHPGLKDPELSHPALPFLLFAAHLLPHSMRAAELMLEAGFLEALRDLWVQDFPITYLYRQRWVPADKRLATMRLASALVLGGMASHGELRLRVARRVLASERTASWFWDIAAYALYLRLDPKSGRSASDSPILALAFLIMETKHKFPGDYDLRLRLESSYSLVWIFQTCGNPEVDHKLREFSLDCLLHLAVQPTIRWTETLYILSSCNADTVDTLQLALSHAIQHCIARSHDVDSICSLQALYELTAARKLFMPNPLDRFVMLMSNASRRNEYVSLAFANSGAKQLVDCLEAGRFDTSRLDRESASWRARTCLDVRLKMLDTDN